jgi:hypothetical protein
VLNQYPSEDLPSKGFLFYGRHLAGQMGFIEEGAPGMVELPSPFVESVALADSAEWSDYWAMLMC